MSAAAPKRTRRRDDDALGDAPPGGDSESDSEAWGDATEEDVPLPGSSIVRR